jgi:hypothetical protein
MKAFKKGQKVTRVTNWDRKGTFVYQQCEVISCGKKQMALMSVETGMTVGRHFRPDGSDGTHEAMTNEEAVAECLRQAEEFLARRREDLTRLSGMTEYGEGYCNAMRNELAALHEPRGYSEVDRMDEIRRRAGLPANRK